MRQRTSRIATVAAGLAAAAALAAGPGAQAPAPRRRRIPAARRTTPTGRWRGPLRTRRPVAIPRSDEHQRPGDRRRGRRTRNLAPHLRRVRHQRRLADGRQRRDLDLDLRRLCVDEHRRSRRRPVEPGRPVGRHRRVQHLSRLDARRRRLQVHRRRPHVRAHGTLRHADDCPGDRASGERRHGVRRGVRARVDGQRGARRLQDDRRRPHVEEGLLPQPAHRRDRSRHGSRPIPTRSTRRCGSACAASGAIPASSRATTKGASGRRPTAATAGRRSTPGFRRRRFAAASASTSRARTRRCSTRWSTTTSPGGPARDGERDAYARPIHEARIKAAEVYRTDDKGATWRKVSESNDFMSGHSGTYGWVFGQIRVDPKDDRPSTRMGLALNVSRDAGKTFTILRGMHVDHHGLWIDPANSSVLYNVNDGGIYLSADAGATWKFAVSAGGAQFYNVTLDASTPGVGVRLHPGHRQPPRQGRPQRRAREDSRGGMDRRARRGRLVPGRRSREPEHRLLARLLRKLHARRPQHPGAAARPRCRPGRRARGGAGTAGRPRRPAAQHAHPSAGRRTSARSGWRRFSSRRTTRAPSTPASSTSSARSIAARPGRRSAPTSPTTIASRMLRAELERDPVPDRVRARRIAEETRRSSTRAPTTAACT